VQKVTVKSKLQSATLIITDQSIYTIGGIFGNKVTRRSSIKSVNSIALSTLADSYVLIRCTNEQDLLIESDKKTEITATLYTLYKDLNQGTLLKVEFSDALPFFDNPKDLKIKKDIKFTKDDALKKTQFKVIKDTIQISTMTGLPRDAGASRKKVYAAPSEKSREIKKTGVVKGVEVVARAKALHDYTAKNARELTFKQGDIINVTKKNISGTWQGELYGKNGAFPSNLVQII